MFATRIESCSFKHLAVEEMCPIITGSEPSTLSFADSCGFMAYYLAGLGLAGKIVECVDAAAAFEQLYITILFSAEAFCLPACCTPHVKQS